MIECLFVAVATELNDNHPYLAIINFIILNMDFFVEVYEPPLQQAQLKFQKGDVAPVFR